MDRAAALATPLAELAAWHLVIDCGGPCRRIRQLDIAHLLRRVPAKTTLATVVNRLRCEDCRRRPLSAAIASRASGAGGRAVQVQLIARPETPREPV